MTGAASAPSDGDPAKASRPESRVTVEQAARPGRRGSVALPFRWQGEGNRQDAGSWGWPADRMLRWGLRAWSAVGMILLAYLLVLMFGYLRVLLVPLLTAGLLVYLLNPVVSGLARWGLPRALGAALAYLVGLGVLGGGLLLVGPGLLEQVQAGFAGLPTDLQDVENRVQALADRSGVPVQVDLNADRVQQWLVDNRDAIVGSLTGLGSFTASVLTSLAVLLVGAVVAFYLLVDLPRVRALALALVPPARRREVTELGSEVSSSVGGFLRGQLIVATFVGLSTTLAMWLVGLPFWLVVGAVAGVTNIVPYIGPFIGAALAVLIALVYGDPLLALWAAGAIAVVQQVESSLVSPLVMGKTVHLHPVVVIAAILLGGSLAGFIGLLVAVPVAASLRVLFLHAWEQESPYSEDLTDLTSPESSTGTHRPSSGSSQSGPTHL